MLALFFAGCKSDADELRTGKARAASTENDQQESGEEQGQFDEMITIKVFSNLPDRKNGQGLVEQILIDEYMAQHQNINIEVEALEEEAYKTKFKAYAMYEMPDVVSIWGQPSFLDEISDAGVLARLNLSDYEDYGFIPGSLEGFQKDGKLYGLPRNTDIMLFYYNQRMFQDNSWKVPQTYDELLELCKSVREKAIAPVAMAGGDGWPLACFLTDLLVKVAGTDYAGLVKNAVRTGDFTAQEFVRAAGILTDSVKAGMFQDGYDTQDYGTAMNLFTSGQAAMYYMGSWDCSMALNESIDAEIRDNIRAFTMPVVKDGAGGANDIAVWNGGGYAVSANSEVKAEAVRFLNYMYQPDKLSKYGWENGVGMSAQDQSAYLTGEEPGLQKQVVNILKHASSVSGTPVNDCGPSQFKNAIENEIQDMSNGSISIEDFFADIGKACK
ncbi:extracellular solute-binding protein [Lachnospiraceae bacterium]|nr:extracellular solute-binding protein [Lachnospiraceae bacterium]